MATLTRRREAEAGSFVPEGSNDSLSIYLREIGRYPLLSAEDEVRLAQVIEAGRAETAKPVASRKSAVIAAGEQAHERFVHANLRLVVSQVKAYVSYNDTSLGFLDLIQEGNLGLLRALEKFDWRRGYKFSTSAIWWVRQTISRANHEQSRLVRIPVHMSEKLHSINRAIARIVEHGEEPTPEAIATEVKLPVETVEDVLAHDYRSVSLEKPLTNSKNEHTIGDLLEDPQPEDLTDQVSRILKAERVHAVIREVLTPRERQVIALRYGLLDDRAQTLEEVGKALKVTRERIRQIEVVALRKLRGALSQDREAVA
jgi:RNA polymerase primary sigma factor